MMPVSRQFILDVITKYRERPCLWQVTHPDYRDKKKRNAALDDFLELFRSVDPDSNRETILKKLSSLRSSFNKEKRKVEASLVFRQGAGEVHVPKLWYFDHLKFLTDQDVPQKSITPMPLIDEMPFKEEENETTFADSTSECSQVSSGTSSSKPKKSFKRPKHKADQVWDKIAKRMEEPIQSSRNARQPHDAYGEHIAEKLRSLPPSMIPFCQKLINEAIFFAEFEKLNFTSRIVTEHPPTPPVPRPSSTSTARGPITTDDLTPAGNSTTS